jgi:hypothetical protein
MKRHSSQPSVVYLLSDVEDPELKEKLEHQFIQYEGLKKMYVEAQRNAFRAQANATKTLAEVQLSQLDFLIAASGAFDLISTEPVWMIRRRGDGQIIMECLLTERDIQRMARAETKKMKERTMEITDGDSEDDPESDEDMFK